MDHMLILFLFLDEIEKSDSDSRSVILDFEYIWSNVKKTSSDGAGYANQEKFSRDLQGYVADEYLVETQKGYKITGFGEQHARVLRNLVKRRALTSAP